MHNTSEIKCTFDNADLNRKEAFLEKKMQSSHPFFIHVDAFILTS